MKKLIPIIVLGALTSFSTPLTSCKKEVAAKDESATLSDKTVFICDSQTAKKYHFSKNCRGLSNCKHKIVEVTITKAKSGGRTLCGWED